MPTIRHNLKESGSAKGAKPTDAGFNVENPFGRFELPEMQLAEGWYELVVKGSNARICLELFELSTFKIIDLEAKTQSPGFVKLAGGTYRPVVYPGVRPGRYIIDEAWFQPMSQVKKARLFGGRLYQALTRGVSLKQLRNQASLALSKRTTYGMRSRSNATRLQGVLSDADLEISTLDFNSVERISKIGEGPIFLLAGSVCGQLDRQLYRRFTVDSSQHYDYLVQIGENECLTPDALLLFAEAVGKDQSTEVILADKWVNDKPTKHAAWDPVLYAGGLPTPYCVKKGFVPVAQFQNMHCFSNIPVPVAVSKRAEIFNPLRPKVEVKERQVPCSIIIPTRDRADILSQCLAGLFDNTSWPHEVLVIDNGSIEPETAKLFEQYRPLGLRTIRSDTPFNFSALCNEGVHAAVHPFVVLLNNDIVLNDPDWLSEMMRFAVLPNVGAVGAKLLYPDGRLQHAGVMLGLTQLCGHLWRGLDPFSQLGESHIQTSSARSAVTAACLCVEKKKFKLVGGLNETDFPVTLNDIDLCLKLGRRGFVNVYASNVVAYHHESESRGDDTKELDKSARRFTEMQAFYNAWAHLIFDDPWLPLSVSRSTEVCKYR